MAKGTWLPQEMVCLVLSMAFKNYSKKVMLLAGELVLLKIIGERPKTQFARMKSYSNRTFT